MAGFAPALEIIDVLDFTSWKNRAFCWSRQLHDCGAGKDLNGRLPDRDLALPEPAMTALVGLATTPLLDIGDTIDAPAPLLAAQDHDAMRTALPPIMAGPQRHCGQRRDLLAARPWAFPVLPGGAKGPRQAGHPATLDPAGKAP
ncbi:hypothetical protein [Pelagibacterium halotolerans]|uniref:hypothetical protein n=1 Tax=Pelagibacterium halotolerans TaxID=531813 RepID=UPI00384FF4C0